MPLSQDGQPFVGAIPFGKPGSQQRLWPRLAAVPEVPEVPEELSHEPHLHLVLEREVSCLPVSSHHLASTSCDNAHST